MKLLKGRSPVVIAERLQQILLLYFENPLEIPGQFAVNTRSHYAINVVSLAVEYLIYTRGVSPSQQGLTIITVFASEPVALVPTYARL